MVPRHIRKIHSFFCCSGNWMGFDEIRPRKFLGGLVTAACGKMKLIIIVKFFSPL